ncbi:MAG: MBL fold metallo-hydrolase [Bacteroidetes bacterium]|nr:MAG: MBL fold metallo-hydrolase [Bacteroidota bacterium]
MLTVKSFTFNPYQENTYVISDASGACAIIDPGCYTQPERDQLHAYIGSHKLQVEKLLNTHGHIDHMMGNRMVKARYQVPFVTHEGVIAELAAVPAYGAMMGLQAEPSPDPDVLVAEGDTVSFGDTELEVLFTPGHSAGHISFFHRASGSLFSGDVLFYDSIGRTDLPGGSMPVLMDSIFKKLLPLGDEVKVYCGHGPATTIGRERRQNPFLLHYAQHGQI